MKRIITLFIFCLLSTVAYGQCSTVGISISSSDTTSIQLYNAGFFNIPSGFANVCEWEVSTFSGEIIHEDTTSGSTAAEQTTSLFEHSVPITDSMHVSLVITNEIEGIICTINDTLYWEETEVLPGVFIGNWAVLSSNVGVEEDIVNTSELSHPNREIILFPSPTVDFLMVKSDMDFQYCTIHQPNGLKLASFDRIQSQGKLDLSNYSSGMYFIQFWDSKNRKVGTKKFLKM